MSQRQPFRAEPILRGLTGFQRNTVEHVMDRFYGPDPTDRFLVADETGLGKTIVARGVIARTIEELQHNDAVDRIDIVYICSNQDLAQQNLAKLAVTGDRHHGIASRLTLLAKHFGQLTPQGADHALKQVNLISFTPGTSFSASWQSGKAEERAMLYLLLEAPMGLDRDERRAANACRVLQGSVSTPERFRSHHVEWLRGQLTDGIAPGIAEAFLAAAGRTAPISELATGADLLAEFETLVETIDRADISWHRTWRLVGNLRTALARESVRLLTPDLVILDEFQRFRDLLDPATEAGELADHLFGYHDPDTGHRAKALLLSATPFKPFTYAEEEQAGESSHRDFLQIVGFLANGEESGTTARIGAALRDYREAIVTGGAAGDITERVRRELLRVMARTERPRTRATSMTVEISQTLGTPPQEDLLGYVAMKELARAVDAPISLDYWKSAPYFVNFMDGYKVADRVRGALDDPARAGGVRTALERTQRIDFAAKEAYQPIDPGNARLRVLAGETVGRGWWKLLWVPPSLPYLTPGGPYAEDDARRMTKRLIFSSWTATPSSVASLLSYEADRLGAGQEFVGTTSEERDRLGRTRRSRLAYRLDREGERERPSSMSTLAIFWPMPGLAALGDPRNPDLHRGDTSGDLDPADLHAHVAARLRTEHPPEPPGAPAAESGESAGPAASHWYEALRRPDASPDGLTLDLVQTAVSRAEETDGPEQEPDSGGSARDRGELQARHIEQALRIRGAAQDRRVTDATVDTMAQVAAHSPGNVAYRALRRITAEAEGVSEIGLWSAAARVGSALRTLFSRPETVLLLDQLIPDEMPYWRKVLRYCAWGNLQAVLDEYLHHLDVGLGDRAFDDDRLMGLAGSVAAALELRPASYEVFDPDDPSVRPKFLARFALRFGGRRENEESNRQPLVRQAFNSPFWPFVLATTSVGQEGVDFHWWCHAVMHWNIPANPVDFEQREGRVDRYDGHAVRRNIAARHGGAILASAEADPWREAYARAGDEAERLGEFSPHWVYPGQARIERHVAPYPLSIDSARLEAIKRDVALYRLAFGQPRQEDMLQLLRMRFSEATEEELAALRLDLSAPGRSRRE